MFKAIVLAAYVAVSFAGVFLTSAMPAAAEDFDEAFNDFADACGVGYHRDYNGICRLN